MANDPTFRDLLARVRTGDQDAATELFRQFEPTLRIEIRRRLRDPYLNAEFDSGDVCQSVFLSFYLRAAAGEYDLSDSLDLQKLLARIARNKVASRVRHTQTQARDPRRVEGGSETIDALPNGPAPDRIVAGRELLDRFRSLLTEEERQLVDLRSSGRTWPEIAAELGGQPQTHRHRHDRALARVLQQLGIEDADDGGHGGLL